MRTAWATWRATWAAWFDHVRRGARRLRHLWAPRRPARQRDPELVRAKVRNRQLRRRLDRAEDRLRWIEAQMVVGGQIDGPAPRFPTFEPEGRR